LRLTVSSAAVRFINFSSYTIIFIIIIITFSFIFRKRRYRNVCNYYCYYYNFVNDFQF